MANPSLFPPSHADEAIDQVIITGSSQTQVLDCAGCTLCGVIVDEHLSNANLTFQVAVRKNDGMVGLYDGAAPPALVNYTVPVIAPGAKAAITIPPIVFAGFRYVKILSSAPVGGDSHITFVVRPV